MPQIATQADGLIDTITTQKEALASLTQTVARGVPALRDAAENVLELNPAANSPLLTSHPNDIGLSFYGGTVSIVDSTGQDPRSLDAAHVNSVSASFSGVDVNSAGVDATGQTILCSNLGSDAIHTAAASMDSSGVFGNQVNGNVGSFGGVDVNSAGVDASGKTILCSNLSSATVHTAGASMDSGGVFGNTVSAGSLNAGNGAVGGVTMAGNIITATGIYATNAQFNNTNAGVLSYTALVPPPSERSMKTEQSVIDNGLHVVQMLVPARWKWQEQADPRVDDTATHASVYVDEVADAAPELVMDRGDGTRSYDDRGLTAYLISAVQTLADQVATLTARLDALEATA